MLTWRYPDAPIECGPEFVEGIREKEWIVQAKYDGWRAVIHTDESRVPTMFSKSGNLLAQTNAKIPAILLQELTQICKRLPLLSVLDSELVGPRGGHDPRIFLFDLLAWDGQWVSKMPFHQRREMLIGRCEPTSYVTHAETVTSGFMDFFQQLRKVWYDGGASLLTLHEGIVLKRRTGKLTLSLTSNSKSPHMYKLKYRDVLEKRH